MGFDNYIVIRDENDRLCCYVFKRTETYHLFRCVSEAICFSDCTLLEVEEIVFNGKHVEYVGWQPNMLFEYCDIETGEIVWSNSYPNWEH